MSGLQEFRVTFGQRYPREEHPLWPQAHRDGWLAIEAPTAIAARVVALAVLGVHWSDIYGPDADVDWSLFPRGELGRIKYADAPLCLFLHGRFCGHTEDRHQVDEQGRAYCVPCWGSDDDALAFHGFKSAEIPA